MKRAILCVDDEKMVLDNLVDQLESTFGDKFQYEIAESVDEAWEVIDDLVSQGYAMVLVISDWLMPRVKGDTFLVDVHKKYPETVSIMLTGQADPEAVQNAFDNANLYAYIKKPWNEEDLIQRVTLALEKIGVV
ncbi:MAG: response regulator [Bacteroidia bacterium]|nr:response regulator [Bacteroidia bacterium]MDW8333181.1 response regulator [Bacteroidia bacterium]